MGATAVLITVGDEILAGHTLDTNAHWLRGRLRARGVRVVRSETVGDDEAEIAAAVGRALEREAPGWVLVLGGIGPTPDDRTYAGVARALDRPLGASPEAVEHLRSLARRRGVGDEPWADPEQSPAARRMISIPAGAEPLANPLGAALGCVARVAKTRVVVLPGVPAELHAMVEESFEPAYLADARPEEETHELETSGAEARYAETLERVGAEFPRVRVGSYPQDDRGRLLLRVTGPAPDAARALERLRSLIGQEAARTGAKKA